MKANKTPLPPFIDLYLRNHVAQLSTAKTMRWTILKYFGLLLAAPMEQITPLNIEDWFHAIGAHSPTMANKCLSIIHTMFEKAKDWRVFEGENPAQRVKKYKERSRKRFVQPHEMPRLMTALRSSPEVTQCYFLLCLLVGGRRTEGLTMRWIDLDIQNCRWHKPHTKTDRAQTVPIPKALLDRLTALPRQNEFVFATKKGHWSNSLAFERWDVIRSQAGIPDVTIHDLRRTCASWLACHGENLAIISNVLNHSGLQHTAIYARLNMSPVTRALEENSMRMLPTAPPMPSQAVVSEREVIAIPVTAVPVQPTTLPPKAAPSEEEERGPVTLSGREREMLAWFAHGQSNTSIGQRLGISHKTVSTYRGHLIRKLQLKNVAQLIRYAIEHEADWTMQAPVQPIVHRSHSIEREEWPG